ncbi:MAG TPA: hypothetical protein VF120_08450 [Ktedonobacterales bacterium]
MQLRFELGDADKPRGHAILYAHLSGGASPARYIATYCVVLPIAFSMAKYLPPMLSGQIPAEAMGEGLSVVPIPPMLEDIPDFDVLRATANRRDDDLCDLGTLLLSDDSQRLIYATQACQEYGQLYARFRERWPEPLPEPENPLPGVEVDVEEVATAILPERTRLGEMSRLISQARYAIEGGDQASLQAAERSLRRIADSLPGKYHADQLVEAALRKDTVGPRLAELYLQRAFKLADEDYIGIPPLDEQIRALQGDEGPHCDS